MNSNVVEIMKKCPLIQEIRGRLGDHVFYMRGNKICARRHVIPRNPRTRRQQENRIRFREAVGRWHELSATERERWNERAINLNKSGFNLFLGEHLGIKNDASASIRIPSARLFSEHRLSPAIACVPDAPEDSNQAHVMQRTCFSYHSRAPDGINVKKAA